MTQVTEKKRVQKEEVKPLDRKQAEQIVERTYLEKPGYKKKIIHLFDLTFRVNYWTTGRKQFIEFSHYVVISPTGGIESHDD